MMRLWNLLQEYLCCCWKPRSAVDEDADAAKKAKFAEEKSASGSSQQQQPGKDEAHVEDHQDEDHESEDEEKEDHSQETFIVDSTTGDNDDEDEDEEEEKDVKKGGVFTAKDVAAGPAADQHHRSGSFEVSRNSSVSFSSQQQQHQQQPLTACAQQQQAWSPPTWYPSPSRFLSVEAPPAPILSEPFTLPPISPILMDQERPSTAVAAAATTQKIANRGLIKRVHAVGPEVFKQQQQQQQSTPKPKRRRIETEDDDGVHDDHSATAATTAAAAEHLLFSPTNSNNSTEASLSAVNTAAISPGTICPRSDKEDEDGDDDDEEDEVYSDVILG